jgi:colicin import membrane protein
MRDFLREHAWAVTVSVFLHGMLVSVFVLASLNFLRPPPPNLEPLPIDAVAIDSQVLHAAQHAQEERAAQARAAEEATAAAAAEEQAKADEAKAAQEAKVAADTKAAEAAKAAEEAKAAADTKAAEEAQATAAADTAKAAATAAAARRAAEADLAAQEKREGEAKKAAEAEAKRVAEAKQAADAKRAADERARADREAELRKQLADEEHRSAVESGPLRDSYIAKLRNRIQNAWIKPPSASVGLDCMVEVTQIPGGEVTGARVTQCNGDAAARQSIENAVYRASPLPEPPDPALFERNFVFRFKPNE